MINLLDVDNIYRRYGYVVKNRENIRIYEFKQGRYFGVDFFNHSNSAKLEKIKAEYTEQGYATLIRNYKSELEVEEELFKSFFQISNFRSALKRRYDTFIHYQLAALPESAKYEYIRSPYNFMQYDLDGIPVFSEEFDNRCVVEHVSTLIKSSEKPLFVIIEAAAGFGKTCSAYELLNSICNLDEGVVPLYIELSRNREARIFKHILQNEIEKQFQNVVTSDVVIHEIKRGKIPVIIDGFDELLSKDLSKNDSQLRDVESMLATIVNLLDGKAKIIITSRKTAIFSGEEFYEWMQNSANKYSVARFSIAEPQISNWLSNEQIEILDKAKFPISNLANPVLLSYVRNTPLQELSELISNTKNLIDKYFDFILSRERIRQNFSFDNETQLRILKKLVRFMTEFDIKSEKKSLIKELIRDYNTKIFENYRREYPIIPKPTNDDLADILSNHALLDRKQNDEIGIINEFILGILIGRNLLEGKYQEHYPADFSSIISQDFAYLSLLSFKVQPEERKLALWQVYKNPGFRYNVEFQFQRDIFLRNRTTDVYVGGVIEEFICNDIDFDSDSKFIDFVFRDCKFTNCLFNYNSFQNSGFVNCKFFNCTWTNHLANCDQAKEAYFAGCKANNGFLECVYEEVEQERTHEVNLEELILKYFIKVDGRTSSMKRLMKIREDLSQYGVKQVDKTINSLEKKNFIALNGGMCFIQREGINYFNNNFHF